MSKQNDQPHSTDLTTILPLKHRDDEEKELVNRQPIVTTTGTSLTAKNVTPHVLCELRADKVCEITGQPRTWVEGMLIHRQGAQQGQRSAGIVWLQGAPTGA